MVDETSVVSECVNPLEFDENLAVSQIPFSSDPFDWWKVHKERFPEDITPGNESATLCSAAQGREALVLCENAKLTC
ncbi:32291_t:CDS:2 [Gigaspora margarita]|uniref:32291_t:CDS:1 n=1 Tax=Gigaspora margarita TaxID=4874 RepID=A0ABN7ULN7_GIGMA|nr:32291_t:CDS:2 [Gigaspora margarita]